MSQKNFKLWMIILAVLAPSGAFAESTWDRTPGSGTGDCIFASGDAVCFSDYDADESSPMLDTRLCENFTATWVSNIAATSHDNDITIRWSVAATASVNTSGIMQNLTLTGDPTTSLDRLLGFDAPWIYADITTYTSGTGRLAIHCFKQGE